MSSHTDAGFRAARRPEWPGGCSVAAVLRDPHLCSQGERRTVTTLFADVRGFASLALRVEPDQAVAAINEVFDVLARAIPPTPGLVHRVLGDCLLSIFGTPDVEDDHAAAATRAALDLRAAFDEPTGVLRQQHRHVRAGFGINTGTVVAGRIGTGEDAAYTVVGHAVTVASRLAATALSGQILVGAGTAALLSLEFDVRDRGTMELPGVGALPVFELVR